MSYSANLTDTLHFPNFDGHKRRGGGALPIAPEPLVFTNTLTSLQICLHFRWNATWHCFSCIVNVLSFSESQIQNQQGSLVIWNSYAPGTKITADKWGSNWTHTSALSQGFLRPSKHWYLHHHLNRPKVQIAELWSIWDGWKINMVNFCSDGFVIDRKCYNVKVISLRFKIRTHTFMVLVKGLIPHKSRRTKKSIGRIFTTFNP